MTTPSVDRDAVRTRLREDRERLEAEIADVIDAGALGEASTPGSDRELSSADQHPADDATNVQYLEQDAGQVEALRADIVDIDAALQRLEDGTYGRCVACGREIGPERLDALPATPYCIDDAQRAEQDAALRPPAP